MAQLYYRYSTMNAGKSIELIKVAYNYEERGKNVLTLVPAVDNRFGIGVITSRIGLQRDAMVIHDETNIFEMFLRENAKRKIDCGTTRILFLLGLIFVGIFINNFDLVKKEYKKKATAKP